MTTHSRLSPSGRYRWQLCPGSVNALSQYEGGGMSSAAAIDGTHSHTLLETCLKNDRPAKSYIGMVLSDKDGMFAPDADRCARVQIALDYITRRKDELLATEVIAEQFVDPVALVGRDDMGGTVDVQLHSPAVLELIDYKDGINKVSPKDNPQLEQYFFGVIGSLLSSGCTPLYRTVRLTIIQPKSSEPITSAEYDFADLFAKLEALTAEAAATDGPDAPLVAGEKQCHYCAHKANCKTFTDWSFGRAGIKFEKILPAVEEAEPVKMADQQLCELLEAAPLIRRMLEEAEGEALKRIISGHPIPGLKVVTGRGTRGWAFEEAEMERKLARFKIPKAEIWRKSLISPAQAEKLTWTSRDGAEHQMTPKQIELMNNEFVKRSDGKLTVVSEADKRPGMTFGDLTKMFAPVPEAPAAEAPMPTWLS